MAQKYRGSKTNYVDIAVRGTDTLGLGIDYAIHPPSNAGYLLVRFVAHGEDLSNGKFTHLTYREKAQFLKLGEDQSQAEVFNGVRLNKVPVKVFEPPVQPYEVAGFVDKFDLWPLLTDWVTTQVTAEGFTVTVDLEAEIKALLSTPATEPESVTCLFEFPNLTDAKAQEKKAALAAEEVEEDEDGDDTSGPIKKDWLN